MGSFVTVVVLLAIVGAGVFLIRRLRNQRDERIDVFPYDHPRPVVREPAPSDTNKARSRAGTIGTGDPRDHGDGGRGPLPPRARAGTPEK